MPTAVGILTLLAGQIALKAHLSLKNTDFFYILYLRAFISNSAQLNVIFLKPAF